MRSEQLFAGDYHTAFKGKGMQFSEVRAYSYGDDVRHIEWNVSARMQTPYVKLFEEEREQTVMLLVDVSASVFTSIGATDRAEMLAELMATLAFAAIKSQDKAGLLLFDDKVRAYLPPKKGVSQMLQMLRQFFQTAQSPGTEPANFKLASDYLQQVHRSPAVVFLLSDFLMTDYKEAVKALSRRNDLMGLAVKDPLDEMLPDIGLVQAKDAETGALVWVDTGSEVYRQWYRGQAEAQQSYFKRTFAEAGADCLTLPTESDFFNSLQVFFRKRALRR